MAERDVLDIVKALDEGRADAILMKSLLTDTYGEPIASMNGLEDLGFTTSRGRIVVTPGHKVLFNTWSGALPYSGEGYAGWGDILAREGKDGSLELAANTAPFGAFLAAGRAAPGNSILVYHPGGKGDLFNWHPYMEVQNRPVIPFDEVTGRRGAPARYRKGGLGYKSDTARSFPKARSVATRLLLDSFLQRPAIANVMRGLAPDGSAEGEMADAAVQVLEESFGLPPESLGAWRDGVWREYAKRMLTPARLLAFLQKVGKKMGTDALGLGMDEDVEDLLGAADADLESYGVNKLILPGESDEDLYDRIAESMGRWGDKADRQQVENFIVDKMVDNLYYTCLKAKENLPHMEEWLKRRREGEEGVERMRMYRSSTVEGEELQEAERAAGNPEEKARLLDELKRLRQSLSIAESQVKRLSGKKDSGSLARRVVKGIRACLKELDGLEEGELRDYYEDRVLSLYARYQSMEGALSGSGKKLAELEEKKEATSKRIGEIESKLSDIEKGEERLKKAHEAFRKMVVLREKPQARIVTLATTADQIVGGDDWMGGREASVVPNMSGKLLKSAVLLSSGRDWLVDNVMEKCNLYFQIRQERSSIPAAAVYEKVFGRSPYDTPSDEEIKDFRSSWRSLADGMRRQRGIAEAVARRY